jgi:hypothetical protein
MVMFSEQSANRTYRVRNCDHAAAWFPLKRTFSEAAIGAAKCAHVRYGLSKAPLWSSAGHFRSTPIIGHSQCPSAGSETHFPSGFKIFTNSAWIASLPQITLPLVSASSLPSMPETVPPASRTMIWPAAISQDCRLRSQ